MAKVVVSEFLSLDGVMEDPGGAEGFQFGGWSMAYWNDDVAKFKYDELVAADALLLGRITYQGFAAAWPKMTDGGDFADRMNNMAKYVASKTLGSVEWTNSRLLAGDLVSEVGALRACEGGDILVAGSASVAQALFAHQLVDELRLAVYPILLGTGKQLFGPGGYNKLTLVNAQPTATGVTLLTYRRAEEA